MTTLQRLFDEQGQSPWLDNLRRGYFRDGTLQRLVDQGIRGVTSNPTIFQKAIAASEDYDEQFAEATSRVSVEDAYWELVVDDIQHACDVLRPLFDESRGADGHVSIEVSPALARDTAGTAREAIGMGPGRPSEPDGQDPRDGRGAARHPLVGRRRDQRERHPHLRGAPLRRGDRGVPERGRGPAGRGRRPLLRPLGGQLLHQPGRRRGRPAAPDRRHRPGRPAAGHGGGEPGQAGLRAVPAALRG